MSAIYPISQQGAVLALSKPHACELLGAQNAKIVTTPLPYDFKTVSDAHVNWHKTLEAKSYYAAIKSLTGKAMAFATDIRHSPVFEISDLSSRGQTLFMRHWAPSDLKPYGISVRSALKSALVDKKVAVLSDLDEYHPVERVSLLDFTQELWEKLAVCSWASIENGKIRVEWIYTHISRPLCNSVEELTGAPMALCPADAKAKFGENVFPATIKLRGYRTRRTIKRRYAELLQENYCELFESDGMFYPLVHILSSDVYKRRTGPGSSGATEES